MRILVWQKSKHFDRGKWNCGCRASFLWFHSVSVERTLWTSMLLFLVHGRICLTLWWHILWAELLIHLTAIPLWGLDGAPGLLVLFMLHTSITADRGFTVWLQTWRPRVLLRTYSEHLKKCPCAHLLTSCGEPATTGECGDWQLLSIHIQHHFFPWENVALLVAVPAFPVVLLC